MALNALPVNVAVLFDSFITCIVGMKYTCSVCVYQCVAVTSFIVCEVHSHVCVYVLAPLVCLALLLWSIRDVIKLVKFGDVVTKGLAWPGVIAIPLHGFYMT